MTQLSDVNEMTEFVERVATRTAELTTAKVAEALRAEIGRIRDLTNRVTQTVYGDNGHGVLGQIERIQRNCEIRKQECQTAMNLVRAQAARPAATLKRWQWMALGFGVAMAGVASFVNVLYRLQIIGR